MTTETTTWSSISVGPTTTIAVSLGRLGLLFEVRGRWGGTTDPISRVGTTAEFISSRRTDKSLPALRGGGGVSDALRVDTHRRVLSVVGYSVVPCSDSEQAMSAKSASGMWEAMAFAICATETGTPEWPP